jgi:hypothetical protein
MRVRTAVREASQCESESLNVRVRVVLFYKHKGHQSYMIYITSHIYHLQDAIQDATSYKHDVQEKM